MVVALFVQHVEEILALSFAVAHFLCNPLHEEDGIHITDMLQGDHYDLKLEGTKVKSVQLEQIDFSQHGRRDGSRAILLQMEHFKRAGTGPRSSSLWNEHSFQERIWKDLLCEIRHDTVQAINILQIKSSIFF